MPEALEEAVRVTEHALAFSAVLDDNSRYFEGVGGQDATERVDKSDGGGRVANQSGEKCVSQANVSVERRDKTKGKHTSNSDLGYDLTICLGRAVGDDLFVKLEDLERGSKNGAHC